MLLSCHREFPSRRCALALLAIVLPLVLAGSAAAFVPFARWTNVPALGYYPGGIGDAMGDPLKLTWSIVPDGTTIPAQTGLHQQSTSSLNSFLDGIFPGGSDEWLPIFEQSFDRWTTLSGITFEYEENDSSAISLGTASGSEGNRGDIRIGGTLMNGAGGTLAYSFYPNNSDMVLDTGDGAYFGNSSSNYRRLRNTIMHEIGHGLGLDHVLSDDARFLMEPSINTQIDGPQLDDIRGVQWYYGDALEKNNNGQGNDTAALAWNLGSIDPGSTKSIGTGASPDLVVASSDTDFVSIDSNFDVDYYSFTVAGPASLSAVLTPLGGTFNQSPEGQTPTPFNANDQSKLSLAIFAPNDPMPLGNANQLPAGQAETLMAVSLPAAGQYFARVTGNSDIVQLYQLQLSVAAGAMLPLGDYNGDGSVNAADYTVWRNTLGTSVPTGTGADGTGPLGFPDGLVTQLDYEFWKAHYGNPSGSGATSFLTGVPEPTAVVLAGIGIMLACVRCRRKLPLAA